jgi:hypothetical protein
LQAAARSGAKQKPAAGRRAFGSTSRVDAGQLFESDNQRKNSHSKMMIGIGTPSIHSKTLRSMIASRFALNWRDNGAAGLLVP